jgi:hypothetical protein
MTDLFIQSRILYHLYQSFNERKYADYSTLKAEKDLFYISNSKLEAELTYLIDDGYVNRDRVGFGLELSSKGVISYTTIHLSDSSISRRFFCSREILISVHIYAGQHLTCTLTNIVPR